MITMLIVWALMGAVVGLITALTMYEDSIQKKSISIVLGTVGALAAGLVAVSTDYLPLTYSISSAVICLLGSALLLSFASGFKG